MMLNVARYLLLPGALVSTVVFAQAPAQQQAQPPQQGQQQAKPAEQGQKPIYRVAVDLVTTDAIVRDRQGQFVADLKKDDFEIY
jgi:hypothetical protein